MVAAKWWSKVYGYEYLGILENMLVFMCPSVAKDDDDLLAHAENTILHVYEDWARKTGFESQISRVLWIRGDIERGLIEETIRKQNIYEAT